ncbi:hypothetical protein [Fluviispira multicolorata]|uniref:Uncharacterized protein n=1 Tax=Fluviispira multicolorata TaxID=2654512 RepID=A0A833JEV5_9BACT|nr:hypothetical protein [Fluviispira multicolorata]KAB8033419.1 hypothetical protein GCL57_01585 [Fluviispira multicolorata]
MLPQSLLEFYHAHQVFILKFFFASLFILILHLTLLFPTANKKIKTILILLNLYFIFNYLLEQKNDLFLFKFSLFLICLVLFQYTLTWIMQRFKGFFLYLKLLFSLKIKNQKTTVSESKTPKNLSSFGSPQILTSFGLKVRSKSEVFIAEKLFENKIDFEYELALSADGKTYYPDFTIKLGKKTYYWEHFGMLSDEEYYKKTKIKIIWYEKNFPKKLIMTEEGHDLFPKICTEIDRLKQLKRRWLPRLLLTLKKSRASKEYASRTRPI